MLIEGQMPIKQHGKNVHSYIGEEHIIYDNYFRIVIMTVTTVNVLLSKYQDSNFEDSSTYYHV